MTSFDDKNESCQCRLERCKMCNPDKTPEYKYPTFEDWYEKVRKNDYKESWVDVWNSARELK